MEKELESSRLYTLVSSYVNGTIKNKDIPSIEKKIGEDEEIKNLYLKKTQEQEFLLALIPNKNEEKSRFNYLRKEIAEITNEVYPKEKKTVLRSVKNFLEKPVLTIKY